MSNTNWPEADALREAWGKCGDAQRKRILEHLRAECLSDTRAALDRALADLLESAPVEGGEPVLARAKKNVEDSFVREVARHTETQLKLAAVAEHRDKLRDQVEFLKQMLDATTEDRSKLEAAFERIVPQRARDQDGTVEGMERWIRDTLAAAEKERDFLLESLKQTERARDDGHCRLDAAHRSFSTQLADLQRALEAEKKAHNEALKSASRPERAVDRDLREALVEWLNCGRAKDTDRLSLLACAASRWLAAPLSAPDAPASKPPARALETWAAQFGDGSCEFGFLSPETAMNYGSGIVRAHKVALPIIETVECGA